MSNMKLEVPNAILFVLEPDNPEVEIPAYGGLISSTSTCVSVGTLADVDGETEVILDQAPVAGLQRVFDGVLSTKTGTIAIVTAHGHSLNRPGY